MPRIPILALAALAGVCALAGAAGAETRSCRDEIARVQSLIDKAEAGGPPVPDMKESTFATTHHQPTPATVLAADKDALAKAKAAVDRAKKAEAAHSDAACLKAIDEIAY
jgi:hypothetical protein